MMPYISRADGVTVRMDMHYKQVMRKMGIGTDEFGEPLIQTARQKALFTEIFGENAMDFSPPVLNEALAMLAAEKMPHEWQEIPLWSRAKWMAARRIDSMAKTLERYRETMERRRKQALTKNTNKARGNRRKR